MDVDRRLGIVWGPHGMASDAPLQALALDRRLNAYRPDLADTRLRGRVDAERFVEAQAASVTAPSAPLKGAPDAAAETTATLLRGEPLYVFELRGDGWAWVQSGWDRYVGYARGEALDMPERAPTHRVASLYATIYPEPSFKRPPMTSAPLGAQLSVMDVEPVNGFLPLTARNSAAAGTGGWAHAAQLRRLDALRENPAGDWVRIAELFLGAPYLWGGETAMGIDCSGLVQVAVQSTGRVCPRDADMQAAALGRPLAEGAPLERGDFFFWRGHVGVMADATTLLHASAHNMICLTEPLEKVRRRFVELGYGDEIGVRRLEV